MSEIPFPPRDEHDALAYPHEEVVAGYMAYERGDPIPGGNHSPGYRWGWSNRCHDDTKAEDGLSGIRLAVAHRVVASPVREG